MSSNRWAPLLVLAAVLATACSSSGSNLSSDCTALCGKVSSAGCAQSTCVSDCEDTSPLPSSCVSAYETLVHCGASSGTVVCTSSSDNVAGCESQAVDMDNCLSANSVSCPSGNYDLTCQNIVCTSTEVTAQCRATNGTYVNTHLSLPCSYVSNCNGQLTCSQTC